MSEFKKDMRCIVKIYCHFDDQEEAIVLEVSPSGERVKLRIMGEKGGTWYKAMDVTLLEVLP